MSIDYRIPKVEVKVDILVDNGFSRIEKPGEKCQDYCEEYIMYLDKLSRYRKGQETIYEYLNTKKKFIPLKHTATNEVVIFNQDDLFFLWEKETSEAEFHKKVLVFLKGGGQLEVDHFKPLPDSHSRVLDYLNEENQFILFFFHNRKIFINKNKIVKVKEK